MRRLILLAVWIFHKAFLIRAISVLGAVNVSLSFSSFELDNVEVLSAESRLIFVVLVCAHKKPQGEVAFGVQQSIVSARATLSYGLAKVESEAQEVTRLPRGNAFADHKNSLKGVWLILRPTKDSTNSSVSVAASPL